MLDLEYIDQRLLIRINNEIIFNWGPFETKTEAFAYAQQELEPILQQALKALSVGLFQQKAVRVKAERVYTLGIEHKDTVKIGDWIVDDQVYTSEQFTKRFEPV